MEAVLNLNYTAGQIKQVNWCRLYLQVTRLTEIATLNGSSIDPIAWTGDDRLSSHHDWPRQGRPGRTSWSLWRRTMTKRFCHQPDGRILASQPGNLVQPLGTWLPQSRPFQLAHWTSFLDPESNRLFIPSARPTMPPTFSVVHPLNRHMTHFISFDVINIPGPIQQVAELPLVIIPVVIIPQAPLVKIEKSRTPIALPPPMPATPPATSFTEYCSSLPIWEQQLILHVQKHESQVSLSDCLSDNVPLCLCTNGGALKHIGSIGWVIATDEELLWDCTAALLLGGRLILFDLKD
jgi:hypothetical protein